VQDLEEEVKQLEQEEAALLASVQQTVGGMSDLRYGRLANPELRDEVIEGLQAVQRACDEKK
jgi:centromere-localized protein 2